MNPKGGSGRHGGGTGCPTPPAHHHQGYATEAVHAAVGPFTTRGLHRFGAYYDTRNTASIRVLERTGFRLERHGIEDTLIRGEWTDTYSFGLLARHWKGPSPTN
ncbi:GNAT family N-acetyltransferase [Streptomyces sp. NPDC060334]|uniref:GNAT family N-acetyltransferase n=1 Tax=Streptomyces sp. NPDC060334 TaxID=3347099 RepID=UPI00365E9503